MPRKPKSEEPTEVERRLGDRVAALRQAAGLTQAELAERLEVAVETISRLERGSVVPSLPRLARLAETLSVELIDLFTHPRGVRQKAEDRLAAVLRGRSAEEIELIADLAKRIFVPPAQPRSARRQGKR
jgi:transcriptional regulator with XRE-family HTH domain